MILPKRTEKGSFEYLERQSVLITKKIAERLNWKVDRVKYYLNTLKRKKAVERVGSSQKGFWKINERAEEGEKD